MFRWRNNKGDDARRFWFRLALCPLQNHITSVARDLSPRHTFPGGLRNIFFGIVKSDRFGSVDEMAETKKSLKTGSEPFGN